MGEIESIEGSACENVRGKMLAEGTRCATGYSPVRGGTDCSRNLKSGGIREITQPSHTETKERGERSNLSDSLSNRDTKEAVVLWDEPEEPDRAEPAAV